MKYLLLVIFIISLTVLTACNNNAEVAEEASSNAVKTEMADAEVNKVQDRKVPPIYYSPFDTRYPGSGPFTLVDGVFGSTDYNDGKWQGFGDRKLDVAIDLGKEEEIKSISANFLVNIEGHIFLPESFEVLASSDLDYFFSVWKVHPDIPTMMQDVSIGSLSIDSLDISARYIRVIAISLEAVPDWYENYKGNPAWFFIDEIVIE